MITSEIMAQKSYGLISDWYPRERHVDIQNSMIELTDEHRSITQVDGVGCVSATAAFIINRCIRERCVTATDMDAELGRRPNEPADTVLLAKWLLDKGFHLDMFTPPHPLDEVCEKYMQGKISFTDYLVKYEEIYGKVAGEEIENVRAYFENTYIPSNKKFDSYIAPYEKNGRATRSKLGFSSQLLSSRLREGIYFLGFIAGEYSRSHAISLFRVKPNFPLMMFVPNEGKEGGSEVTTFDSELRQDIIGYNCPFSFISNPNHVTKKDLGL